MAEITLDRSKTALLMADFSAGNMAQNPIVTERQTFERASEVDDAHCYRAAMSRVAWVGVVVPTGTKRPVGGETIAPSRYIQRPRTIVDSTVYRVVIPS